MANFKNNRNNGSTGYSQASVVYNVGDFLQPTGLGTYIPYAGAIQALYLSGIVGTFALGETVTGGTSTATGVVVAVSSAGITVSTIVGTFQAAETVTGGTSSATGTVASLGVITKKLFGLSLDSIQTTDAEFAQSNELNISNPVNILDFVQIEVSAGTATAGLVGTYVDVDPTDPGKVDVSAVGTQIYVTKVISATLIEGTISLIV